MSVIEKLKAKLAAANAEKLPSVGQPMLDRIENSVVGGVSDVWCEASWGQGCDRVNASEE
ncbi:hypothetical protein [Duganella sp. S19_KUP01_CR8]|uniref:hypothetical protein n=1 Tax=Duganella sp. S19_KUP01_CR8 TaxID=3025502 RepID=UPI002FCD924B